jgi:Tfp pilus assembly protein PilN
VRAVNLLPGGPKHGGGMSLGRLGPAHAVIGVLLVALVYVTVYVLTSNTISEHKTQLASLQTQLSQEQAQIGRLSSYTQFAKLAQQRADTVKQIAASRFDWHGALSDLSKVMPANAKLLSLRATVSSGATVSGGSTGSAAGGNLRGAINAPAFELSGCAATQDDVARLISRLRLINGVQRVSLEDSSKSSGGATASSPSAGSAGSGGCSSNSPDFDMVVFFQALPGASATGAGAPSSGAPVSSPAGATTTASQATTTSTSTGAGK